MIPATPIYLFLSAQPFTRPGLYPPAAAAITGALAPSILRSNSLED